MNLARMLAALLSVAASLFAAGEAKAQDFSRCFSSDEYAACQTREDAYAARSQLEALRTGSQAVCIANVGSDYVLFELTYASNCTGAVRTRRRRSWVVECVTGSWDPALSICVACAGGQDRGLAFPGELGVYDCQEGTCPASAQLQPDGFVRWISIPGPVCGANEACPTGTTPSAVVPGRCIPEEHCPAGTLKDLETGACVSPGVCPDGQAKDQFGLCKPKDNQCPPGQIKSPEGSCLPGEGQCGAGQARGSDGTCKKDSDGDGKPDDDDGDGVPDGDDVPEPKFSGGDDCDVPPQCSGDNIMCGQARIQWRIDCNTRKNAQITGGQCGAPPVCAGDGCKAMDYAILLTTWRTACALEGDAGPGGSERGLKDYLEGERKGERAALQAIVGEGDGLAGVSEGDHWATFEAGSFNEGLFGGGAPMQCDFLGGPLQIMGRPIELPGELWSLFQWIGWITVASSYLWLAFKLGE